MNDDVIFERNVQAWLEVGPSVAPDRVVRAALHTIETTPQQRDIRVSWRFPHMTVSKRFALAAAVGVLAIAVVGALLVQRPQAQVGAPTPIPTPAPTSSPLSLAALQASWASVGTRDDPLYGQHPQFETITVNQTGLRISGYRDITSSASIAELGNELRLRMETPQEMLTADSWDCTTGDTGTYNVSLSPDEQILTLTSLSDRCTTRGVILTGDWTRWVCPPAHEYADCDHVSEFAPGRYVSPVFRPFDAGTSGQLAYTLSAGWANLSRPPTWPGPGGAASWVSLSRFDAPDVAAINILTNIRPSNVRATPSTSTPTLGCPSHFDAAGATASQIADFLLSLPYLSASGRTPITIGGLAGVQIDVSLVAGFVSPCPAMTTAEGQIVYSTDIEILQRNSDQTAISLGSPNGDTYARFIVLDSGAEADVIEVGAPDQSTFDARVADAMPVIQSFEFIR